MRLSFYLSVFLKPNLTYSKINSSNSFLFGLYRKLYSVQATVLKDNEDKVVVEETFPPETSLQEEKETKSQEQSEISSSNTLEKWVIKIEQSVNIFLTVNLPQICLVYQKELCLECSSCDYEENYLAYGSLLYSSLTNYFKLITLEYVDTNVHFFC